MLQAGVDVSSTTQTFGRVVITVWMVQRILLQMHRNVKQQILNVAAAGRDATWLFWLTVFLIEWGSLRISFTSTMMKVKTLT